MPMEEEKYNLRWNSHHSIIANNVLEHLAGEELVDVTLSCEGKFIRAHKLILSAASQYFKELFQLHKGQDPVIVMMNVRFEYIQYIIDYIYKGEIKLLYSELEGILKLANDLQIKGLCGILNRKIESLTEKMAKSPQRIEDMIERNQSSDVELPSYEVIQPFSENPILRNFVIIGQDEISSKSLDSEKKRSVEKKEVHKVYKRRKIEEKQNLHKHGFNSPSNSTDPELSGVELSTRNLSDIVSQENHEILQPISESQLINVRSADSPTSLKESTTKFNAVKLTSAFMLFTEEYRKKVSLEYPDENIKQISLRLSRMWKNLPHEEKDSFYEAASRENEKLKRRIKNE